MSRIPLYIRVWGSGRATLNYSGMDSRAQCADPVHFEQYAWPVEYNYNSRGFRDREWCQDFDQLKNSVWCLGDSFTVGLGSPVAHTWPRVLSDLAQKPIVNCSMDGASNEWLSDLAVSILDAFDPPNMVIMWSYTHRRVGTAQRADNKIVYDQTPQWKTAYESMREVFWPRCNTLAQFNALPSDIRQQVLDRIGEDQFRNDLTARVHYVQATDQDDLENFQQCVDRVRQFQRQRIVHAAVPHFAPHDMMAASRAVIEQQPCWIPQFQNLDFARDGHHFDIKTSQWVAEQIQPLLL